MTPERRAWLAALTPARVALSRAGGSLTTADRLALRADHAQARDAVRHSFDAPAVEATLRELGLASVSVQSAATDRDEYVRRPDRGRTLADRDRRSLSDLSSPGCDLAIVLCDGLSPGAVEHAGPALAAAITAHPSLRDLSSSEVVIVSNGRVAIGDEVGALLQAALVVVVIGERPGLSVPASLGVYITHGPRVGRTDAERNCISNIHPHGLGIDEAALRVAEVIVEATAHGVTGVALGAEPARAGQPFGISGVGVHEPR